MDIEEMGFCDIIYLFYVGSNEGDHTVDFHLSIQMKEEPGGILCRSDYR